MSGSFAAGWAPGDPWIAAESNKIVGQFYDHTTSGTDASVTVTLPSGGADISFTFQLVGDASATSIWLRYNADSSAIYEHVDLGSGTVVAGATKIDLGALAGAPSTAGSSTAGSLTIPNYRGALWKLCSSRTTSCAATTAMIFVDGAWRSTAAITTVTFLPNAGNFTTGSRIRGYVSG